MDLIFEPLDQRHDRAAFACGEESVDRFLKEHARKRMETNAATTIVAYAKTNPTEIIGYYTLVPHEFRGLELPTSFRKQMRIGNLNAIPAVLLAQLGVRREHQGRGIGVALVNHALHRCARLAADYGAVAVVTDPINERAAKLYASFDFELLAADQMRMILPMKRLILALEQQERLNTLTELAERRFGSAEAAQWIAKPEPSLGGRSPATCCLTDDDFERAAALLRPS